MAQRQIPGGAYVNEPASAKQAQIPGSVYINTSTTGASNEAALSGSALTGGIGTQVPSFSIGL